MNIKMDKAVWMAKRGLSPRARAAVLRICAKNHFLGDYRVPALLVPQNRYIRHGNVDAIRNVIQVPIRAFEEARAFGVYSIVHQFVHLFMVEKCQDGWGWRSKVHSKDFHFHEQRLLNIFGLQVVYRQQNQDCEIQSLDGKKICNGLGQ